MKVYVVTEVVMHEGQTIQGIYLNEGKAREALVEWEKLLPVTEGAYRKSVWYDLAEHDAEE